MEQNKNTRIQSHTVIGLVHETQQVHLHVTVDCVIRALVCILSKRWSHGHIQVHSSDLNHGDWGADKVCQPPREEPAQPDLLSARLVQQNTRSPDVQRVNEEVLSWDTMGYIQIGESVFGRVICLLLAGEYQIRGDCINEVLTTHRIPKSLWYWKIGGAGR